eukprot:GSMAST32.ASY1.ANO1.2824.1 assembled CDS
MSLTQAVILRCYGVSGFQDSIRLYRTSTCTKLVPGVEVLWHRRRSRRRQNREHRNNVNPITTLDFAPADDRYLLAGAVDGSIAIYDVDSRYSTFKSRTRRRRNVSINHHQACITSLQWYPADTGMFLSSSTDGTVKVWDTNECKVATEFKFPNTRIFTAALSPIASQHTLIGVGSSGSSLQLCDLLTGGASHMLLGHTSQILSATWSPCEEYVIATGSSDRTIKLWDVRRAGGDACLLNFDMNETSGTIQSQNRSRYAHDGAITALRWLPNGQHILSYGNDSRMRLWNRKGYNMQAHYADTVNNQKKGSGFAVASPTSSMQDSIVFCPNGSSIRGFNVMNPEGNFNDDEPSQIQSYSRIRNIRRGTKHWLGCASTNAGPVSFGGHFGSVNTLAWRNSLQTLWSGSDDGLILAYESRQDKQITTETDKWSSSDEEK